MDKVQKPAKNGRPTQPEAKAAGVNRYIDIFKRSVQENLTAKKLLQLAEAFIKRPDTPRILSLLLLLALIILKPGPVTFLFLTGLVIGLILLLMLGPDRIQTWVINRYRRLRESDPVAAERVRRRAAGASKKLSQFVEKLPESWTVGLYLPDFEEPEELPETWTSDPFERLANQ